MNHLRNLWVVSRDDSTRRCQLGNYKPAFTVTTARPSGICSWSINSRILLVRRVTAEVVTWPDHVSPVLVLVKKPSCLMRYKFAREATPSFRAPAAQATEAQNMLVHRIQKHYHGDDSWVQIFETCRCYLPGVPCPRPFISGILSSMTSAACCHPSLICSGVNFGIENSLGTTYVSTLL